MEYDKCYGFVKLDRSILRWNWYGDTNTFRVYIHLLLSAQWEDSYVGEIYVPRGSVLTSYQKIADMTSLSVQNVRTAIKHLKTTGEITVSYSGKFSIISINSWDEYQTANIIPNRKSTGCQHTDQHDANNIQEIKKQRNKEYNIRARARERKEKEPSYDLEEYELRYKTPPLTVPKRPQ